MDKKLFEFGIKEWKYEDSHWFTEYVWATSIEEAQKLAHDYCLSFYDDEEDNEIEEYSPNCFRNDFASWELRSTREFSGVYISPINGEVIKFELPDSMTK